MSHGFSIVAGDTAPNLIIDTNADLTGATARLRLRDGPSGKSLIDRAATITDAPNGIVDGGDGSTLPAGDYEFRAVVTFAGGEIQNFPQRGWLELHVEAAIPVPA